MEVSRGSRWRPVSGSGLTGAEGAGLAGGSTRAATTSCAVVRGRLIMWPVIIGSPARFRLPCRTECRSWACSGAWGDGAVAATDGLGGHLGGDRRQDAALVLGLGGQQVTGAFGLEVEGAPQLAQEVQPVQTQ